jgi:hypothetical protein
MKKQEAPKQENTASVICISQEFFFVRKGRKGQTLSILPKFVTNFPEQILILCQDMLMLHVTESSRGVPAT